MAVSRTFTIFFPFLGCTGPARCALELNKCQLFSLENTLVDYGFRLSRPLATQLPLDRRRNRGSALPCCRSGFLLSHLRCPLADLGAGGRRLMWQSRTARAVTPVTDPCHRARLGIDINPRTDNRSYRSVHSGCVVSAGEYSNAFHQPFSPPATRLQLHTLPNSVHPSTKSETSEGNHNHDVLQVKISDTLKDFLILLIGGLQLEAILPVRHGGNFVLAQHEHCSGRKPYHHIRVCKVNPAESTDGASLMARDRGNPRLIFQVLIIYPMLDATIMRPGWWTESHAPTVSRESKNEIGRSESPFCLPDFCSELEGFAASARHNRRR